SIDIQQDQSEPFRQLLTRLNGSADLDLVPVVRSRLAAIKGTPVAPDVRTRRDDAWHLQREYALTWAAEPPRHNTVIEGRWWTPAEAARAALISVEEETAKQLGVCLVLTLTFVIHLVSGTAIVKT